MVGLVTSIVLTTWIRLCAEFAPAELEDPGWTYLAYGPAALSALSGATLLLTGKNRRYGFSLLLAGGVAVVLHFVYVLTVAFPGTT